MKSTTKKVVTEICLSAEFVGVHLFGTLNSYLTEIRNFYITFFIAF